MFSVIMNNDKIVGVAEITFYMEFFGNILVKLI